MISNTGISLLEGMIQTVGHT